MCQLKIQNTLLSKAKLNMVVNYGKVIAFNKIGE